MTASSYRLTLRVGYFLLGDSLNTTVTVIGTLQNTIVAYNTLQLTYLLIVGIAAQALGKTTHTYSFLNQSADLLFVTGIWSFWNIQKRFQLPTKTMFNIIAVGIVVLDAWGMVRYPHFHVRTMETANETIY